MDYVHTAIVSLGASVGFFSLVYLLSLKLKDASIIDIAWGLSFIVIARALELTSDQPFLLYLIILPVTLWGARLAFHIGSRKIGEGEDWRYQQWRKDWGKNFWWMSYFRIFLLQSILALVVAAPIWISAIQTSYEFNFLQVIGLSLWLVGFLFETIGDWQLGQFIRAKKAGKTKKQIMTTGLWRYTRHPNYFGEVTLWWGLWLVVLPASWGWLGIISPLMITYLLLKVSGIPMLEKKYKGNKEFEKYKQRTSAFFPLPPKGKMTR